METLIDQLTEQIQLLKTDGKSASEAVNLVYQEIIVPVIANADKAEGDTLSRSVTGNTGGGYTLKRRGAHELARSTVTVYVAAITPLEMGVMMKNIYGDAPDVVEGVYGGFPSMTATEMGLLLLSPELYPTMTQEEMREALTTSGAYTTEEADQAIATIYNQPQEYSFTVQAKTKWQSSGQMIAANQTATITYQSGYWTANPSTGLVDAGGNRRYTAKAGYVLQGAKEGALIGRLNNGGTVSPPFLIGKSCQVPNNYEGVLECCINDDIKPRYGDGFADNRGQVVILISIAAKNS